jgi:hypothetical protein
VLLGIASGHSEQSEAQSRNPAAKPLDVVSGFLECARDDFVAAGREIFRANPYNIDGHNLFYAPSIGTDPGVADIIIEQAKAAAQS